MNQTKWHSTFPRGESNQEVSSTSSEAEFCKLVEKGKRIHQSGRHLSGCPFAALDYQIGIVVDIYRRLRTKNLLPQPFLYRSGWFPGGRFLPGKSGHRSGWRVMTNPIAGTRRRGKNEEEDNELKKELLADDKERAETWCSWIWEGTTLAGLANSAASSWISSWKWIFIHTLCTSFRRWPANWNRVDLLWSLERAFACRDRIRCAKNKGDGHHRRMETKRGIYAGAVRLFFL